MSESIVTNNVLYKFTLKDDRVFYTHGPCVTFSNHPDWASVLWNDYKQFQFVLISNVPPGTHCAACQVVIKPEN